jgi:prepilin peptidase CpaA
MMLSLTFQQAIWFLPLALPICVWAAMTDLREMRIPNVAVLALTAVFLVTGGALVALGAFSLGDFGFRLLQLVVVLIAGFIITSLGLAGAGDSKFAAAMAPFIAPGDYLFFVMLFSLVLIGSWITHRGAGRVPAVRRATAEWASWESGKLFPMGVALAGALVIYLAMGVAQGL